MVTSNTDHEPK